jgi:hypothetical protein
MAIVKTRTAATGNITVPTTNWVANRGWATVDTDKDGSGLETI